MRAHPIAAGLASLLAVVAAATPFACSSLPELEFVGDGGNVTNPPDATPTPDAPTDADASKPDTGPSRDAAFVCDPLVVKGGKCCGNKLCVNCSVNDCTDCQSLTTCAGTEQAACCRTGAGASAKVSCAAASACP